MTDEDRRADDTINPGTAKVRKRIEQHLGSGDKQVQWAVNLEHCFGIATGKATPEVSQLKLSAATWEAYYPKFKAVLADLAAWICTHA